MEKETQQQNNIIQLPKEDIDLYAAQAENEAEFVLRLYKHAFPQWDDIEAIDKWPSISSHTSTYIAEICMEQFRTTIGIWFNNGFSSLEPPDEDWQIDLSTCIVTMKPIEGVE